MKELTLEQELRLIKFKSDVVKANREQLLELIELMFVSDILKTDAFNEMIRNSWFK